MNQSRLILRLTLRWCGLAAVYWLATWADARLNPSTSYAYFCQFAAGVGLGAILIGGYGLLPGLIVGAAILPLQRHESYMAVSAIVVAAIVHAVTGAWLARRWKQNRTTCLGSSLDAFWLLSSIFLASAFSAIIVSSLYWETDALWTGRLIQTTQFWLGTSLGSLAVTPLILVWWHRFPRSITWERALEGTLLVAAVVAIGWKTLGTSRVNLLTDMCSLACPIPLLVWSALRFGRRGTMLLVTALLILVTLNVAASAGSLDAATFQSESLHARSHVTALLVTVLILSTAVSERIRTMDDARTTETRYRMLFQQSPDAVLVIDCQTSRPIHFNDKAPELLGYSHAEFEKLRLEEFELPESRHTAGSSFESPPPRGYSPNHPAEYETTYRCKDGKLIPVAVRFSSVKFADRQAFLMIVRDLTEQREAETEIQDLNAELAHSSRLSIMGEMAAGVAHELQQPLAVITNYANGCLRRLRSGTADFDSLAAAIGDVVQEAGRASRIIRHIRDFVHKRAMRRMRQKLDDSVFDALQLANVACRQRSIRVVFHDRQPSPSVFVDRIQMTQVILNLLLNAIDAMHDAPIEDRLITLTMRVPDSQFVELAVTDHGCGISVEDRERVFDQFFTTKHDGLGMGLAISRSIVEGHGGRLTVSSEVGRGSTFRLSLPLDTSHSSHTWPASDDLESSSDFADDTDA